MEFDTKSNRASQQAQTVQRKPDTDAATSKTSYSSDPALIQRSKAKLEASLLSLQRACNVAQTPTVARSTSSKATVQRLNLDPVSTGGQKESSGLSGDITEQIKVKSGGGEPLPPALQHHLETGLHADLSKVRIHKDADDLTKSVHAKAFTSNQDIFFSSGLYQPDTPEGVKLIAHEATHAVQQASGLVTQPGIDPDEHLEQEAQNTGAKLAANFDFSGNTQKSEGMQQLSKDGQASGAIQREAGVSAARIKNMTYDTLLETMAVDLGYKTTFNAEDEALLSHFGYTHSNVVNHGTMQCRLYYPSQKSYPYAILAFRGTETGRGIAETLGDLMADADPIGPGHSQWRDSKEEILKVLQYGMERSKSRVWVTGHSLGGALAQYTASNFPNMVGRVVTFQSPAIANPDADQLRKFNRKHPNRAVNSTHYEVEGDAVPALSHMNPLGIFPTSKTPGTITRFKPRFALDPLGAHLATPMYNQLNSLSPEAYQPFKDHNFPGTPLVNPKADINQDFQVSASWHHN